jgi:hypothetical protein
MGKVVRAHTWNEVDADYSRHFGDTCNEIYPARMALDTLIVKEWLKLIDEEAVV